MEVGSKIGIIGAGISGLSIAYWLKKSGYSVTVFEKSNHIGGCIHTIKDGDFLLDMGPNSTLETCPELKELIKELGLEEQKQYGNQASNTRYILKKGTLVPLPMSPLKFIITPLFSTRSKLRLLKEPFLKPTKEEDISLADFVRYRLGNEFLDYAINPFVAGVYAGDPEKLSTAVAFPKLYALEQKYGSLIKGAIQGARERKKRKEVAKDRAKLFSFRDGMEVLPNALVENLKGEIKPGTTIQSIRKVDNGFELEMENKAGLETEYFDKVVLAVPAYALGSIIRDLDPTISTLLGKVKYPPVAVVTMAFRNEQIDRPLDGFGFLVPEKEKRKILGCIWSSTIFQNRAPNNYSLLTTFIGGTRQPELVHQDDEQLSSMVFNELNSILGLRGKAERIRIKRWEKAIPQYSIGYRRVKESFDRLELLFPGLYITGNTRMGISVGDSVLCAHQILQKIKETEYQADF